MDTGLEAIGTNAHELPMVYGAIARDDDELREAPYRVLRDWAKMYDGNLLIVLPDCFGTTAFLRDAPDWVADWKGARPEFQAADRGRAGTDRLVALSEAAIRAKSSSSSPTRWTSTSIEESARALRGQVNLSFGWGTNLTNDFMGCAPAGADGDLRAISLVCKVVEAEGRPAVKLSDNPNKQLGSAERNRALPARVRRRRAWRSQPVEV